MMRFYLLLLVAWLAVLQPHPVFAHGGVVEEEDLCVIKVNYLRGHFKIYQPLLDGHEEYCEDLPNATESIFVMEYMHDSLANAAVDFRIVRDVTGKGRFARWEDVEAIPDLDAVTVFYREPRVDPDVLTVMHEFTEEGHFIGIVTANVTGDDQVHRAVFPFEVGYTGVGYWPFFILLLAAIQVHYLLMSGRLKTWWSARSAATALLLVLVMQSDADAETWRSDRGLFEVRIESSLQPIAINQMHSWTLYLDSEGTAVSGAELTVTGGMPEHDHGMPTRPRVTEEVAAGVYRLRGMRFHMAGQWEIVVEIDAGGRRDTVTILLNL